MTPPAILFEDGEALVIDKPGGLPLETPRRGGIALSDQLGALQLGFQTVPVPVHRLDADTSGCLLLARNGKALKRFSRAFEDREVEKRYLGILSGIPSAAGGTIELALAKISSASAGWRMIPARAGKASATAWRVVAVHEGRALVEFRPETGRTHQIRVHAASGIGLPLLGDPVYGSGPDAAAGVGRTMLHAASLVVPRGARPPIRASAPLPTDFGGLGFVSDPGNHG